mmetsp:Transcript_15862/g.26030  ORF Transcript_15862/g.26030 Transcript_15862/m.26030 type:complete len:229 (+) Transcript_15862:62-748(+)
MITVVVPLPLLLHLSVDHLPLRTMDVFLELVTADNINIRQINKLVLLVPWIIFRDLIPLPFPLVELKNMRVGVDIIRDRGGINSLAGEGIKELVSMEQRLLPVRDMVDLVVRFLPILVMMPTLVLVVVTVMDQMDTQLMDMEAVAATIVMMRTVDMHLPLLRRVEIIAMFPPLFLRRVKCLMDYIRLHLTLVYVEAVLAIWMGLILLPLILRNVPVVELNPLVVLQAR